MAQCVIGIPTFGTVSMHFTMSLTSIAMPINYTNQFSIVLDKRIDEARNEIAQQVVSDESKPKYLFFLDDDVIMPPNTLRMLVNRMENSPDDIGAISGVYYAKSEPGEPLIFKEKGKGSYYDWTVGDFFQTWAAGCGLVLIRADVLRRMEEQHGKPWFAIDYGLKQTKEGKMEARALTEDLYFYTKMQETIAPNGKPYSLWIDTNIQASHYDKHSKKFFGLQGEEPQAQGRKPIRMEGLKSLAWIGCGGRKDEFPGCQVTRVDELKEFNPDVVAKGNQLPFTDDTFDILYSAHLLHTFTIQEMSAVLGEWRRVLNDSGKIFIKVPDIDYGLAQCKDNPNAALNILYGAKSGLNKDLARAMFEKAGFKNLYIYESANKGELSIMGVK